MMGFEGAEGVSCDQRGLFFLREDHGVLGLLSLGRRVTRRESVGRNWDLEMYFA